MRIIKLVFLSLLRISILFFIGYSLINGFNIANNALTDIEKFRFYAKSMNQQVKQLNFKQRILEKRVQRMSDTLKRVIRRLGPL